MGKPIDKAQFWADRIEVASKSREHYSVYITSQGDWDNINKTHEEIIAQEIPENSKVLDAGCGYGRMSEHFFPQNYTGVDFSIDFVRMAMKKYPEYRFIQANLKDLPFSDKEFDVAMCVSIKRMVRDNLGDAEWDLMLNELKRVAKKVLILEYEDAKEVEVL
jgi:ubiquinone/menaquinone biosynthesis C-methylase UbiE